MIDIGKGKSYEIVEYRKLIMEQIVKSEELRKLLDEEESEHPEETIPFNKSFPHEYVPDTIKETDKFINFDIRADIDSKNKTYKDLTIWFFISCHQHVVPYRENGELYCWYDKVVCALDDIFTGHNILGVGPTYFGTNAPYHPQSKFVGRQITFRVKDFYNGLKNG